MLPKGRFWHFDKKFWDVSWRQKMARLHEKTCLAYVRKLSNNLRLSSNFRG